MAALFAALYGYFCVKLTKVYFAMLTLAFAWITWAVCFRWNEVTGGDQGLSGVPLPDFDWLDRLPLIGGRPSADYFHFLTVILVAFGSGRRAAIVNSPFGRILTTIRDNPERAEFIGVNVRLYQLAVFVIAGVFAGLAGALFGIFNRGVFPDFMYWTKSAEVLIMTLLGGMGTFYGPAVGAFLILWLNQEITAITEYWSLVLGSFWGCCCSCSRAGSARSTLAQLRGPRARRAARRRRARARGPQPQPSFRWLPGGARGQFRRHRGRSPP